MNYIFAIRMPPGKISRGNIAKKKSILIRIVAYIQQ